ncbi:uncharacterized protein B0I36DRAFT_316071 [Microdochium trichocladiopsis]|uniref:Transcription factor domain-containing protein n=1 Tax=Microdochium trichocladiopsis TaxID=1682393 RepID=A0A9P8YGA2_9PEZI|nr:uncharacterized protein B0I36DRAFT_316071 [Microdochium trichocladiopsis]KAH7038377.1 hypothetical protein B0I36DRAFT_316071 [Microdochium trichocladiopsis]
MGLHGPDEADSAQRVPFFLSELRKRAFATSYAQEVGLATFLGRPPRLSYRHCRFTPASGLTNEEILLPAEQRRELLTRLDPHGFRLDGVMNEQAFRKIWWTLSPRREDILELSLCQFGPDEILRRAAEIERHMEELWTILPESMRSARHGPVGYDRISPFERLLHDLCRQAFRSNTLLLQRVIFQQVPGMSSDSLVRNAYHFLDDMLKSAQRPEMATTYRVDALSQLVFHGMRCAAILAVELLRREQLASSGSNGSGNSGNNNNNNNQDPAFSRGRTIRLLSVFVAQLSNVEEGEMWYHNCEQGTGLISRILDKVLDPQPAQQQQQQQQPQQPGAPTEASSASWTAAAEQQESDMQGQRDAAAAGSTAQLPNTAATVPGTLHPYPDMPHLTCERDGTSVLPRQPELAGNTMQSQQAPQQNVNDPQQQQQQQQYNNFNMADVGVDPASSEWAFDFSLDVPLLGNDADLMQWFEAQSAY